MLIGMQIGPFLIEKELGSGAMGTVYKARYARDGKTIPVALKVVALGLLGNEGAMARFTREADILKQLKHPHIVRLFATGHYKKTPFIAMEYIDGEPMDRRLHRRGRFGWEEVATYAKQLCEALQYAHEKGIIHRDLKPSNLMITKDGVLKLTDFGIAKDTDVTALTGMNSTIGTAAYMSPEQCKGDRNLTNKSDLYSLGVLMFELVTGKKPFVADQSIDMFLKHVNEKPSRPSRHIADLPVWFDNLVMFLLEKERDRRPMDAATVRKMLEDIEEKVQNQQSVGADLATARKADRRPDDSAAMDETDKEAARTLRAAAKGKKLKKKKGRPWYEAGWMKVLPLVGFVALLGVGGYYLFKPKSAADLYAEVEAATGGKKRELAEKYLERFGDQSDDLTAKVRESVREFRGKELEGVLEKRFKLQKLRTAQEEEDETAYTAAWSGLEAEGKGEVATALGFWKKCREAGTTAKDRYRDGWGWLADRHIATIDGIDGELDKLREKVRAAQASEEAIKFSSTEAESLALHAVRLSGTLKAAATPTGMPLPFVADPAKARKMWVALADMTRDKADQLSWFLIAGREKGRITEEKPEKAEADRRKLVAGQLAAVRTEWQRVGTTPDFRAEQRDCRNRLRDLLDFYTDEPDGEVKKMIDEARKLLNLMVTA